MSQLIVRRPASALIQLPATRSKARFFNSVLAGCLPAAIRSQAGFPFFGAGWIHQTFVCRLEIRGFIHRLDCSTLGSQSGLSAVLGSRAGFLRYSFAGWIPQICTQTGFINYVFAGWFSAVLCTHAGFQDHAQPTPAAVKNDALSGCTNCCSKCIFAYSS